MKDAASIAERAENENWDTQQITKAIKRYAARLVKAERERCLGIILESDTPGTPGKYERQYMLEAIVEKINTPAKKRPSREK